MRADFLYERYNDGVKSFRRQKVGYFAAAMILQFIFRRAVVFGYFFIAEAIINLAQLAQVVPAVHVEFTAVDKQSAFFAAAHHFGSQIVFLFRGVGKHSAVDNAVA